MVKIGKLMFFFLWMMSIGLLANGSTRVQSYVDQKELALGETVVLTLQVSSEDNVDVRRPAAPEIPGLRLVDSWTSSATSSQMLAGPRGMEVKTVRQTEFHFRFAPEKTGRLRIPALSVEVDGEVRKTPEFFVEVTEQVRAKPPAPGEEADTFGGMVDPVEELQQQMLRRFGLIGPGRPAGPPVRNPNELLVVELELDKTEVFEGEQITANWHLLTRGNILSLDRLKFPDLKGFWKEIIEEVPALSFTQDVRAGIPYDKALLASHALFPIKSGKLFIDEYRIKASIQVPGTGQVLPISRASQRVEINVKPIPLEGRPPTFTGAVGSFTVQFLWDQKPVPINQPFSLKLRIEGEGNAKMIELPPLELPPSLELYGNKSDARYFKNGKSVKDFELLLIPREPGVITVPAMRFDFFDPKTAKYYAEQTPSLEIQVTGSAADILAKDSPSAQGEKPAAAQSLPPLDDKPLIVFSSTQAATPSWSLIFSVTAALSLLLQGVHAWLALKKKKVHVRLQKVVSRRLKDFARTQAKLSQSEQAKALLNLLNFMLGHLFDREGSRFVVEDLLATAPPEFREKFAEELKKIYQDLNFMAFAPAELVGQSWPAEQIRARLQKSSELIARIAKNAALFERESDSV